MEDPWHADLEDAYFEDAEYKMAQDEEDATYYEYALAQEEECEKERINNLKEAMWLIHKELKQRKEMPSWKQIDFFGDWLNSILK